MEAMTASFESSTKAAANADQMFASTLTKGINFAPPQSKGAFAAAPRSKGALAAAPPSKGGYSSAGSPLFLLQSTINFVFY